MWKWGRGQERGRTVLEMHREGVYTVGWGCVEREGILCEWGDMGRVGFVRCLGTGSGSHTLLWKCTFDTCLVSRTYTLCAVLYVWGICMCGAHTRLCGVCLQRTNMDCQCPRLPLSPSLSLETGSPLELETVHYLAPMDGHQTPAIIYPPT